PKSARDVHHATGGVDSWLAGGHPFGPSAILLQQSAPTSSLGQSFAGPPAPPIQQRVSAFPAMVRAAEQMVVTRIARMVLGDGYQLLDLRRCALLFPFHWFW